MGKVTQSRGTAYSLLLPQLHKVGLVRKVVDTLTIFLHCDNVSNKRRCLHTP